MQLVFLWVITAEVVGSNCHYSYKAAFFLSLWDCKDLQVMERFIFTLYCILHMVLMSSFSYIYIYIFLSSHRFLHTSPGSSLCDEYLICTFWNEDYSVLLAAADVSIQWHFVSSLTMAMFQQWCCLCGSYRSTLYVLKLYVAQRNQAVVFVVLLRQLHSLSGFTPLSVVKTHWPRKIDEHLHRLRGLGWQRRKEKCSMRKEEAKSRKGSREGEKEAWDRFLAIRKFLKIESDKSPNGGAALKTNSPNSEDCIFIEKSFTGWLNAIVISN